MTRTFLFTLLCALLFSATASAETLIIQTVGEDGEWIENALVSVSGAGISGTTETAGIFETTVDAGDYRVTVQHGGYEATQEDITVSQDIKRHRIVMKPAIAGFDIAFNVGCVFSSVALENAQITVEHVTASGDAASPTVSLTTDPNGTAIATGLQDGLYRFTVERQGWNTLTFPDEPVRLSNAGDIGISLEPVKIDGSVSVHGENIYTSAGIPIREGKLHGARVDVVGLDWDGVTEVVPLKTIFSRDGLPMPVPELAQIPHLFIVSLDGYETVEQVVQPDELEGVRIDLVTRTTGIDVTIESFFDSPSDPPLVTINRMGPGRAISRSETATPTGDGKFYVRFDKLASGTYEVSARQSGDAGPAQDNGPLPSDSRYGDTQWATRWSSDFVDIKVGQDVPVDVTLEPETSVVRGTLIEEWPAVAPTPKQKSRGLEQAGIRVQFISQQEFTHIPAGSRVFETTTDASGGFAIALPSGRYGIKLPDLTTHVAGRIEQTRITGSRYTIDRNGWNYGDPWTLGTPDPNLCGGFCPSGGLLYDAAHTYEVTVRVRRAETSRNVLIDCQPFSGYPTFVGYAAGQFIPVTECMSPMPVVDSATVPSPGFPILGYHGVQTITDQQWHIPQIPPGSHTINITHPHYTFADVAFDTAVAAAPGVIPSSLGGHPLGVPFVDELEFEHTGTLKPQYAKAGQIAVNLLEWDGFAYNASSGSVEFLGDAPLTAGIKWRISPSGFPATATINNVYASAYVMAELRWSQNLGALTNGDSVTLYIGGPQDSFTATQPGTLPNANITVTAVTAEGTLVPLQIDVFGDAANVVTTGGEGDTPTSIQAAFRNGAPQVLTPNWQVLTSRDIWLDSANLTIERHVLAGRTMQISGTVTIDGTPTAGVLLKAIETGGNERVLGESNPTGGFDFTVPATEMVIQVAQRGFQPAQLVVDPLSNDLLNLTLNLTPLSAPTIANEGINRSGAFLPTVFKSGNATGLDVAGAKEALTATWRVDVTPADLPYSLQRPTGDTRPTTPTPDSVERVMLIDRRVFPDGLQSTSGSNPLPIPPDPNFIDYLALQAQLDPTTVVVSQGTEGAPGQWSGTLEMWRLPRGQFQPVFVVLTTAGAVGVFDYATPQGLEPLNGYAITNGTGTVLNMFGEVDNSVVGLSKKPPFVPSDFSGMIDVVPSEGDLNDGTARTITYDYSFAGSYSQKLDTPTRGPLSLVSNAIGFAAKGELKMVVEGAKSKPVTMQGSGTFTTKFGVDTKFGTPALLAEFVKLGLPFPDVEIQPSMTAGLKQNGTLDTDGGLEEYELSTTYGGKVAVRVSFPISQVLKVLGPIGTAISRVLDKLLSVHTITKGSVGGSITDRIFTVKPEGTTTIPAGDLPQRQGLFGPDNYLTELSGPDSAKITLLAAYGMGVSSLGGRTSASLMMQVGGPADVRDDVRVDLAFDDGWSMVKRVRGAVSIVGKAGVKIACVSVEKTLQFDALRFDIQFGTEPVYDIPEGEFRTTYSTPTTAAAAQWVGKDGRLVEGVFKGSSSAASADFVAWPSAVDGQIQIWAAGREASQGAVVRTAAGVIDMTLIQTTDDVVLVWSELDAASVGDVFATSRVYASRSGDGASWSEPVLVADADGVAVGLSGASVGDRVVVAWGVPVGHALSEQSQVFAAEIGEDSQRVLDTAQWVSMRVDAVNDQIVVTGHQAEFGPSTEVVWNGSFGTPTESAEQLRSSKRVAGGRFYSPITGGIWYQPDGGDPVLVSAAADTARELDVVTLDDGNFGVVWLMVEDGDGVWSVTIDPEGAVVTEQKGVQVGPFTTLSDLRASQGPDGILATMATYKRTGHSVDVVSFPSQGEPTTPNLEDEGPSDDPESFTGGPTGPGDNNDNDDAPDSEDGGCNCATPGQSAPVWPVLFVLGWIAILRRRK